MVHLARLDLVAFADAVEAIAADEPGPSLRRVREVPASPAPA
jgi:hypothetical protein